MVGGRFTFVNLFGRAMAKFPIVVCQFPNLVDGVMCFLELPAVVLTR